MVNFNLDFQGFVKMGGGGGGGGGVMVYKLKLK